LYGFPVIDFEVGQVGELGGKGVPVCKVFAKGGVQGAPTGGKLLGGSGINSAWGCNRKGLEKKKSSKEVTD